ncbi:MAG TPA: ZIP family metal transporter [Kofleriaceae bacterium]|nr:ZIP family metal transporter [Kofleriaceae bacterium]
MTTSRWLWIAAAILVDGLAALVGGVLPDAWLARRRTSLIGFAAGALLAAAMLDILPEALAARGPQALWWATASFTVIALIEWLLSSHVHRRGGTPAAVSPLALLGSDALHNLADGVAIATAFVVSVPVGVVTALAVVVHEVPEEVGDYILLRAAGVSRRRALLALAGVQATAALGAIATLAAAEQTGQVIGIALSIAAGAFLFIAATDLLPEVLRSGTTGRDRIGAAAGFVLGIVAIGAQAAW